MPAALPPVHLEWVAPADCPAASEVERVIADGITSETRTASIEARVVITSDAEGFHGDVSLTYAGATSTRHLVGESCRAILDATTLMVRVAVNEDAVVHPPGKAGPPLVDVPVPPPPAVPDAPGRPRRPFYVEASLATDTALLPSVAFGGEIGVGVALPHFDGEGMATAFAPRSAALSGSPSEGASLWFAHFGGRGCYDVLDAAFDFGPCVGAGIEVVHASGYGPLPFHAESATVEMGAGEFGGRLRFRFSDRIAVRLLGEAVVPFARPPFVIDGAGVVFHPPPASFRGALGAELHF